MIKQQTIVMPIDRGLVYEEENEKKEKFFIQTDFDVKVQEFLDCIERSGDTLIGQTTAVTNDYLVAIVVFTDSKLKSMGLRIPN